MESSAGQRWPLYGAIVGVIAILACSIFARSSSEQSQRCHPYPSCLEAQSEDLPVVLGIAPPPLTVSVYDKKTYVQEADLIAQRWMAWLTGILAVFTGIGVFLLWRTLLKTSEAVRSADAAVRVTREIGENQLRAYLSVRLKVAETDAEGFEIFVIEITNTGQTPARAVVVSERKIEVVQSDGSIYGIENSRPNYELKVDIPPKQKEDWLHGAFETQVDARRSLRELAKQSEKTIGNVKLEFDDVFGRKFHYLIVGQFMFVEGYEYLHAQTLNCNEVQVSTSEVD